MAASMANAGNQLDILIVEDSLTQAEKLRYILEENGYRVYHAANGKEALELFAISKPALVITDIMMPEMDGYELCRQIRQTEQGKDIPVILLTSLSDVGDIIRGLESGASSFITKPYDEHHLLSRIQQLLENVTLRKDQPQDKGIRVFFSDQYHVITANPYQMLDLLLSTYEGAYLQNRELIRIQHELQTWNTELDKKVAQRTAHLHEEILERQKAEAELKKRTEELRDMTQQLWQAAKLATMGELAASIAHELNNPLTIVTLRLESLIESAPQDSPERRNLEIIENECERMTKLVANLLQFSRRAQQQISTLDICDEIESTLELVHYHLRKHKIAVCREFADGIPRVYADRQQIRQLLLNLLTNACDAMPEGGELTIGVTVPPDPGQVVIEVTDTGTGIAPEILQKVYEPFYTTKPEGKGTGLGLAICRRIVKEHKGTFDLISDGIPGKGATARITLPVTNNGNTAGLMDS